MFSDFEGSFDYCSSIILYMVQVFKIKFIIRYSLSKLAKRTIPSSFPINKSDHIQRTYEIDNFRLSLSKLPQRGGGQGRRKQNCPLRGKWGGGCTFIQNCKGGGDREDEKKYLFFMRKFFVQIIQCALRVTRKEVTWFIIIRNFRREGGVKMTPV